MKKIAVDNVIDYFAILPNKKSVNLTELYAQIFNTCAQNFLSGSQKLSIMKNIVFMESLLAKWDKENSERLDAPSTREYFREDLLEIRNEITFFQNWGEGMREAIRFLNSRPRKQWIIQQRRYAEEIGDKFFGCSDLETKGDTKNKISSRVLK